MKIQFRREKLIESSGKKTTFMHLLECGECNQPIDDLRIEFMFRTNLQSIISSVTWSEKKIKC